MVKLLFFVCFLFLERTSFSQVPERIDLKPVKRIECYSYSVDGRDSSLRSIYKLNDGNLVELYSLNVFSIWSYSAKHMSSHYTLEKKSYFYDSINEIQSIITSKQEINKYFSVFIIDDVRFFRRKINSVNYRYKESTFRKSDQQGLIKKEITFKSRNKKNTQRAIDSLLVQPDYSPSSLGINSDLMIIQLYKDASVGKLFTVTLNGRVNQYVLNSFGVIALTFDDTTDEFDYIDVYKFYLIME